MDSFGRRADGRGEQAVIQDIAAPFDNRFRPCAPVPGDAVICFREDAVLFSEEDGMIRFPSVGEAVTPGVSLFALGGRRYFLGEAEPFDGYSYRPVSDLRRIGPREEAFAGVTALHLYRWYRDHRFCGRCGQPMRHSKTERAMVCDCGNTVYPTIAPAVIVGVRSGDRICLTKYNRGYAHWALVAGYTEIGETPEQTVEREVMEETGLRVKNIHYYKSQPWGLSGSLLLGYFCDVEGDDTIRVDHDELKEGRWFTAEEIDFPDDHFSLTREMIGVFKRGSRE